MNQRLSALLTACAAILVGTMALTMFQSSASALVAGATMVVAGLIASGLITPGVLASACVFNTPNVATDSARYRARIRPAPSPQHPRTAGRPLTRAPNLEANSA